MKKYFFIPLVAMLLMIACNKDSNGYHHLKDRDTYHYFNPGDEVYVPYPTGASLVFYNQANTSDTLKFVMPAPTYFKGAYNHHLEDSYEWYDYGERYTSTLKIPNNILDSLNDYDQSSITLSFDSYIGLYIYLGNNFGQISLDTSTTINLQVGNKNYTHVLELTSNDPNGSIYHGKYFVKKLYYDLYKGVVKYEKYNGEVWLLKN